MAETMQEHGEVSASEAKPTLSSSYRPLRIWPPLLLVGGMILARLAPTLIPDGPAYMWMFPAFGPALCGVLIVLWWVTLSRARWQERIVGFVGIVVAVVVTTLVMHPSMAGAAFTVISIPLGLAAFAAGAILLGQLLSFKRTIVAVLLTTLGFGFSACLRSDGIWGNFQIGLQWRWNPSPEEELLADLDNRRTVSIEDFEATEIDRWLAEPEWPAFRGAERIARQTGTILADSWEDDEPEQLWKVSVGPAWSSFVVAGGLIFTQEQRGDMETIVCYEAETGSEAWVREIETRFEESLGGPGPRATPTLFAEGLFVMGANGDVLRLDPQTGEIEWQQDLQSVAKREPPMWGFSSSPLVVGSKVIVHAGGEGEFGTIAFDIESGEVAWTVASGDHSYSSPQLADVDGTPYVMMLTNTGIQLLSPETGEAAFDYDWLYNGYRALQPQLVNGDALLLPTGLGAGTRKLELTSDGDSIQAKEAWTSRYFKPDFNDFVVFEDHAYGFDGSIFACLDLNTGDLAWKGGRYGNGQVLLLEDCGMLLVAGEHGEVVLLKADPGSLQEVGRFQALEGKTWNHPVVVGDRLYIRNGQEAACFRLPIVELAN